MRAMAVLLIGLAGCASASRISVPPEVARSSFESELIAAQQSQITANNAADILALDLLTAEEYVGINASGAIQTKAGFLQGVEKHGPAAVQATPQQLRERQKEWRVRSFGTTGVVTRLTAGDHGLRSWVTAIWVKRNGRLLRVFSQVTAVE